MFKVGDKVVISFLCTGNFYRTGVVTNVQEIFGEFTVKFDGGGKKSFDRDGFGLTADNLKATLDNIMEKINFKKEVKTCSNCKHSEYINNWDYTDNDLVCNKFQEINDKINELSLCKYHVNYKGGDLNV